MPPAVSALSEQMTTISENLEAAIDMSNLMLKYIPTDTLLYKNMSFMQKALFFASALNKGSYAVNGFGHTITVDDFFEIEEGEPPRKKVRVVKSVPLAAGKKPQVAKKTQLSTGPKAGTSSDPTSEPGEGQGDVSDSESESEDVIHPLIEQDLYVYECYNVDIIDAHYNTKTNIKTCPLKNQCYCGEQFEPRLNLLNMRSSMQAKPGLVLTVVSSQRVMTKELHISIIGHSMSTGTSINVPLMVAVLMGILLGMTNSTWYGGICRRIMGCAPPWGALSVMAHFVPNKHNKNTLPHVQGRRRNVAPMVKKNTCVMSVSKSTPQRLH